MKDLLKKVPGHFVVTVLLFCLGVWMLSSVKEPTYEELLHPVPFIGMMIIIVSILFGFIADLFSKD